MATAKTPAEKTEPEAPKDEPQPDQPVQSLPDSTNVANLAVDPRGVTRIVGFTDTTWEPAPVSPTEEEKAHAAKLIEEGIVPAPEKGADAPHVDVPESAKLPKRV